MKIFCINLERAKDRKYHMIKYWVEGLGLDISFWNAYDKKLIENNQYKYMYNDLMCRNSFNRSLSSGEIACATSFIDLYHHVLSNNIKECIIMEDDITPMINHKDILFSRLNDAKLEFPQGSVFLMHNISPKQKYNYNKRRGATNKDIYYIKGKIASMCRKSPWGNQCFYINYNATKIIYDNISMNTKDPVIWHPADYFGSLYLCDKDQVCILNEPICDHDWSKKHIFSYIEN